MTRGADQLPSLEELRCLIGWPEKTRGYCAEESLLYELLILASEHGLGRLHQIVECMRDIWYHPEKVPEYEASRKKRLALLVETRKFIEEEERNERRNVEGEGS